MYTLPLAYWNLGMRSAQVLAEAQIVVAFRMLGMVGGWRVSPSENSRMIIEKVPAILSAYGAATTAALKGERPDQVAQAALRPIGRKTRSNAKRLNRRPRR